MFSVIRRSIRILRWRIDTVDIAEGRRARESIEWVAMRTEHDRKRWVRGRENARGDDNPE